MKKKISLLGMLIILSVIPLILAVSIISVISLNITKSNLEKESKNKLYIVSNSLASYCR